MKTSEIEATLRASLLIQTVSELEEFPYSSYSEFLEARRSGQVQLLTRFDAETVDVLGTGAEKVMFYLLCL
jgi:hypothetical protein